MENSFFCNKCGMIKDRCICAPDNSRQVKTAEISTSRLETLKNQFPDIPENIIEKFPFQKPREGQLEIISEIVDAIDRGYSNIILEAGTGTGKSAVATTLARIYQPSYILTMTKQLQSQYAAEFGYPLVKGRGNFLCKNENLEYSCDQGTCQTIPSTQKFACDYGISKSPFDGEMRAFQDAFGTPIYFRSNDRCSYWDQKAVAVESPITLMNYDYALLELNYVKHFGKRHLMVLDEAHNIEDKLMQRLEVNLYNRRLEREIKKTIPPSMTKYKDPQEWILFVESIYDDYQDINIKNIPKRSADRVNRMKMNLSELSRNLENNPENWVVDTSPSGVSFKPLRVNNYASDRLFNHADIRLLMSATILDQDLFCQWLGIDPDETYYMEIKSIFPQSSRPVHLKLVGNMSQRLIKRTAPKTLPILEKILEHHQNEKGLIHTHNYKCQRYIMKHLKNPRLMGHNPKNREQILNRFEHSQEKRVLVSPSMSEGVDLPYEKCQFQVIYKIPFPYLGDPQVNQRKQLDPPWYAYKTIMTLLQAYGRGMRAEDDYCETYILDGNFRMLLRNRLYRNLVPNFFKEAIQRE
ncbi:helicase C-terminal domain-containing protein [Methanobacterium sp. MZD130B]|jgi:Rad3-related DNA helicase|uniref:helicase C-terminal domain-containing protein n=1 Tax=Methanobacterium sp. MZD130B TaxID=3394378 RepID=UPI0039FCF240